MCTYLRVRIIRLLAKVVAMDTNHFMLGYMQNLGYEQHHFEEAARRRAWPALQVQSDVLAHRFPLDKDPSGSTAYWPQCKGTLLLTDLDTSIC